MSRARSSAARRPIAARPDDWTLHEDRAAVYGKLGREADRELAPARQQIFL